MKLVKYYADWCVPCQNFSPIVERVCKELGVELVEVDVDQLTDEERPDDVQTIPAIRLYSDENQIVAGHNGVMRTNELREFIQQNS